MSRAKVVLLASTLLLAAAGPVAAATPLTRAAYLAQVSAATSVTKVPANLNPSLSQMATKPIPLEGISTLDSCDPFLHRSQIASPIPCNLGNPNGTKTIVLIGDSNTGNWAPALSAGLQDSIYKLAVFPYAGCMTADVTLVAGSTGSGVSLNDCTVWHQKVALAAKALSPVAVLLVAGPNGYSFYKPAVWAAGFNKLFSAASGGSKAVKRVVLGTSPRFAMPVASCLAQRANPKLCGLAPTTTVGGATYQQYLSRDSLIAATSGAKLVAARPYLCTTTFCNSVIGSLITAVDADHFSTVFSTSLAPYMTPDILAAIQ